MHFMQEIRFSLGSLSSTASASRKPRKVIRAGRRGQGAFGVVNQRYFRSFPCHEDVKRFFFFFFVYYSGVCPVWLCLRIFSAFLLSCTLSLRLRSVSFDYSPAGPRGKQSSLSFCHPLASTSFIGPHLRKLRPRTHLSAFLVLPSASFSSKPVRFFLFRLVVAASRDLVLRECLPSLWRLLLHVEERRGQKKKKRQGQKTRTPGKTGKLDDSGLREGMRKIEAGRLFFLDDLWLRGFFGQEPRETTKKTHPATSPSSLQSPP